MVLSSDRLPPYHHVQNPELKHPPSTFQKILDLVLPRNPLTGCRELRLCPVWFEHWYGKTLWKLDVRKKRAELAIQTAPENSNELDPGEIEDSRKTINTSIKTIGQNIVTRASFRKNECIFQFEVTTSKDHRVQSYCGGKIIIDFALAKSLKKQSTEIRNNLANSRNTEFESVTENDILAACLAREVASTDNRDDAKAVERTLIFLDPLMQILKLFLSCRIEELKLEMIHNKENRTHVRNWLLVSKLYCFSTTLKIISFVSWPLKCLATWFNSIDQHQRVLQADRTSMWYMEKSGYKPEGAVVFIMSLQSLEESLNNPPAQKNLWQRFFRANPYVFLDERLKANQQTLQAIIAQRSRLS